jgi:DNA-binding NarL/FixJ family response regulator
MPQTPIRTLIVDDHPGFAELLALMLATDERVQVAGRARNGAEGVAAAASLRPDVVLMDLEMPVLDGIEATRQIVAAAPETRVLVVTGSTSAEDVAGARAAGAVGYLIKGCPPEKILAAVVEAGRTRQSRRNRLSHLLPIGRGAHTVRVGLAGA